MLSNMNIQQSFDGLLVEVKLPPKIEMEINCSNPNDFDYLSTTTTTASSTNDNSFSIYGENTNFHENYLTMSSSSSSSGNCTYTTLTNTILTTAADSTQNEIISPPITSTTEEGIVEKSSASLTADSSDSVISSTISINPKATVIVTKTTQSSLMDTKDKTNCLTNNDNCSNESLQKNQQSMVQHKPNNLLKTINNNNINNNTISSIMADIEDVHNYSKSHSDIKMTTKNENPVDIAADEIDGSQLPVHESTDKLMPDHHARRPMNAFLIFCKRHRAIVREKYPNLENRSITKILGDWWASLEVPEKTYYTNLAKQYKDAFFSANPNFKWYKLPAPPLRTLNTRPTNADRPLFVSTLSYPYVSPYDNYVRMKDDHGFNKDSKSGKDKKQNRSGSDVGMFKFADEDQMGGLNSLMTDHENKGRLGNNNVGENYELEAKEDSRFDKQNELQSALSETINSFEPFANMRYHASKMKASIDSSAISARQTLHTDTDEKHKSEIKSSEKQSQNVFHYPTIKTIHNYGSIFTAERIEPSIDEPRKTSRACKGKRYLEFMSSGKISPVAKKPKYWSTPLIAEDFPANQHHHNNHQNGHYKNHESFLVPVKTEYYDSQQDHLYASIERPSSWANKSNDESMCTPTSPGQIQSGIDLNNSSKIHFDASDFDLEDKIKSLPALSLEKYLTKKRETKKKKKINQKRTQKTPLTIHEARESIQKSMVGSQKRKARKESITRRDVMSLNNDDIIPAISSATNQSIESDSIRLSTMKPSETIDSTSTNATSDLFILASLAEVAATYEVE